MPRTRCGGGARGLALALALGCVISPAPVAGKDVVAKVEKLLEKAKGDGDPERIAGLLDRMKGAAGVVVEDAPGAAVGGGAFKTQL